MLYEDYIAIISLYKGVLKATPEDDKTLKIHYMLIKSFVKNGIHFNELMIKHLGNSHFFPSHIDLKELACENEKLTAIEILNETSKEAKEAKKFLNDTLGLEIPSIYTFEWRVRTQLQIEKWEKQIEKNLSKIKTNKDAIKITTNQKLIGE